MIYSHLIGTPNIGINRELKFSIEKYWKNNNLINLKKLLMNIKKIRIEKIFIQTLNKLNLISINDFSIYDNIYDISCLINALNNNNIITIKKYFEFVRGTNLIKPLKMLKFFNTNYHFIIPENFENIFLCNKKIFNEINEIKNLGILPKFIITGPITYIYLSKKKKIKNIIEIYLFIFLKIKNKISYFQLNEQILCCKLNSYWKKVFVFVYKILQKKIKKIILAPCFNNIQHNLNLINNLKKCVFHLSIKDINLINLIKHSISLGFFENNISKSNLLIIKKFSSKIIFISFENDAKYLPYSNFLEKKIIKYTSFFLQKIKELVLLKKIIKKKINFIDYLYLKKFFVFNEIIIFKNNFKKIEKKKLINNKKFFQYTTIGSFPQNLELRILRNIFFKKLLILNEYNSIIYENIYICIIKQKKNNLNLLTNGEFERTDMVEYFANFIDGMQITLNGWVQSYGTRCVKPPIIFNIKNNTNITENWYNFTKKICNDKIKIILSGPITILKWSFCINEFYKFFYCLQLSNIINNEIIRLQNNNFKIFQIDEPTIKECLPILKNKWKFEINKFLFCFNNCTKNIKKNNEIHTHICYSIFNDIINLINKLNINILTIESTRDEMNNIHNFKNTKINIGAGLFDVHSPIIPLKKNIKNNMLKFFNIININKVWLNPDCGLKTRKWYEIKKILFNINKIKNKIIKNYY